MKSNSICITSGTTSAELQLFAESLADNDRLRGVKKNEGTLLYVRETPVNLRGWLDELWSRISGRAAEERRSARDAIIRIVSQNELDATFRCDDRRKDTFEALRLGLMTSVRSRSMKGRELKLVSQVLAATDRGAPRGPRLHEVPGSIEIVWVTLDILIPLARARSAGERDKLAQKLALLWAGKLDPFLQTPEGRNWASRLALSSGAAFIHELRQRLRQNVVTVNETHFHEVLSKAFAYLTPGLVPGEENKDGSVVFDGRLYVKEKRLGTEGGILLVRYRNPADPADSIIIKRQPAHHSFTGKYDGRNALMREAHRLFQAAEVEGASIRRPLGALRMRDATLGLVLENPGSGRIRDLVAAVMDSDKPESVKTALRLRILTDVASSLTALRHEKNLLNLHFNADNLWIGRDGVTRLGDLGLTERADVFDLAASELFDGASLTLLPGQHPSHLPPEFIGR